MADTADFVGRHVKSHSWFPVSPPVSLRRCFRTCQTFFVVAAAYSVVGGSTFARGEPFLFCGCRCGGRDKPAAFGLGSTAGNEGVRKAIPVGVSAAYIELNLRRVLKAAAHDMLVTLSSFFFCFHAMQQNAQTVKYRGTLEASSTTPEENRSHPHTPRTAAESQDTRTPRTCVPECERGRRVLLIRVRK